MYFLLVLAMFNLCTSTSRNNNTGIQASYLNIKDIIALDKSIVFRRQFEARSM